MTSRLFFVYHSTDLDNPSIFTKHSSTSKSLFSYTSILLLLLILILLLISLDIHPNPGPIDRCYIYTRRVIWQNRSVQCANCSLWVHLYYFGLSLAKFWKISPEHSWTSSKCPSSSQTVSLSLSLKSVLRKITLPFKYSDFSKNSFNLPNHLQLTSTYPSSISSLPPSQLQPSTFHHSPPFQNCLRFSKEFQWNSSLLY